MAIPALGTYEYTQYLLNQAKSLGITGSGVTALQAAPTGTGMITNTTAPSTSTAPLGSTQRTNDLLREASAVTGIAAPTFTQETAVPSITPQTLAPVQSTPFVSAQQTPAYPVGSLEVPQLQPTAQEEKASGLSAKLGDLYNSMVGKSAYQEQQNQAMGVNTAQAAIQDLSAQLQGLKNEAAAIPLQLQQGAADRGVTTTQLGRQENSRLRTNAIAALGVSTLLSAAQGQLANAQAMADRAVAQKYDPILEQITATKANLELIMNDPLTTLADKNRALQQQALQDQKEQQTQLAIQNEKEVWNIATTAASNGSNFKPSGQYVNLAQTLQSISSAPTKEQALQIAVQTGLLTQPAGGSEAKILGSASTGYFTYDPATGQTTPITSSGYSPSGGGTSGGTSGGTTSTSGYKFTATQLNKGALNANMGIDQFQTLNGDVQNFYVNASAGNLSDVREAISAVQSGSVSATEAKSAVDSLSLSPAVKEYLKSLIDQVAPTTTASSGGTLSNIWGGIKSFFGF